MKLSNFFPSSPQSERVIYQLDNLSQRDAIPPAELVNGSLAIVADAGNSEGANYVWSSAANSWLQFYDNQNIQSEPLTISDSSVSLAGVDDISLVGATLRDLGSKSVEISVLEASPLTVSDRSQSYEAVSQLLILGGILSSNTSGSVTLNLAPPEIGAILLPLSQSLFIAADGTNLAEYSSDVGNLPWQEIKLLTTANAPSNQIISNQLVVGEINTGAVLDLGTSDTVLEFAWLVEAGINLSAIARYESEGNMLLVEFSETSITLKSIVNDALLAIAFADYSFTVGETYSLTVRVIGVTFEVLVNNRFRFRYYSNQFLSSTLFGIAQSDGVGAGTGTNGTFEVVYPAGSGDTNTGSGSSSSNTTMLLLDGSDFVDKSSFAHPVTNNGVTIVDGAYIFNRAEQDFLSIPDSEAFNLGSSDFLVEVIAKVNNIANQETKTLVSQTTGTNDASGYFYLYENKVYYSYTLASGSYISSLQGTVPTGIDYAATFNIFKVERVGSDISIFINDTLLATQAIAETIVDSSTDLLIGASGLPGGVRKFDGAIQSVRIEKYG